MGNNMTAKSLPSYEKALEYPRSIEVSVQVDWVQFGFLYATLRVYGVPLLTSQLTYARR